LLEQFVSITVDWRRSNLVLIMVIGVDYWRGNKWWR